MGAVMARVALLAVLLSGLTCGQATAQGPARTPDTVSPPALQRFQIRQDTPAEREAFLKRREAQESGNKPEEVAPLPAQRITPLVSQPQR